MNRPPLDLRAWLDPSQVAWIEDGHSIDVGLDAPSVGRLRLNLFSSQRGLAVACRVLRRHPPQLEALGLHSSARRLINLPHGLVIVCGPTGSGKSTTLAALAQEALQQRPRILITLEDPIEYTIVPLHDEALVYQRQLGDHIHSFSGGLRDALREDPDILMVGEMRDTETISMALTAAETGQLVFATLHSRTASSAIERIIDAYPPERQRQIRVQLADALKAVIAQRLLPRRHGRGRALACELLLSNHSVASLIRDGKTAQIISAIQAAGAQGMESMTRSLVRLIRSGVVLQEDAERVVDDPKALRDHLR